MICVYDSLTFRTSRCFLYSNKHTHTRTRRLFYGCRLRSYQSPLVGKIRLEAEAERHHGIADTRQSKRGMSTDRSVLRYQ